MNKKTKRTENNINRRCHIDLKRVTFDTHRSFNWNRAEQYVYALVDVARHLACYRSVPTVPLVREAVCWMTSILCIEDMQDGVVGYILTVYLARSDNLTQTEKNEIWTTMKCYYGTGNEEDVFLHFMKNSEFVTVARPSRTSHPL